MTAIAGQVSWVGRLAGADTEPPDLNLLFARQVTLLPIAIGSRAQFAAMNRAIALHDLKPVIDRVFSFEEAPAAFRYYASGEAFGKVVIRHP